MYSSTLSLLKSLNMNKFFISTVVCLAGISASAQFVYKIKGDSVLMTNDSCNTELILENSTKNVCGFLFNKGNGRTEFRSALIKLNDSTYRIGCDTLHLHSGISKGFFSPDQTSFGDTYHDANNYIFNVTGLRRFYLRSPSGNLLFQLDPENHLYQLGDASSDGSNMLLFMNAGIGNSNFNVFDNGGNYFKIDGTNQKTTLWKNFYLPDLTLHATDSILVIDGNGKVAYRNAASFTTAITADNGLTVDTSTNVQLGGTLVKNTSLELDNHNFSILNGENRYFEIEPTGDRTFKMGDIDNANNGHRLEISDNVGAFNMKSGASYWLQISTSSNYSILETSNNAIALTGADHKVSIGDVYASGNSTKIIIDDAISKTSLTNAFKLSNYGSGTHSGTLAYNLAVDATGNVIETTAGSSSGTLIGIRVLTSGTSYTPTSGTASISIQLIGGGGGGGGVTGANNNVGAGGGGGSGSYVIKYVTGVGSGPHTYAIGAGGTAGANTGGTGGNGGSTTLTIGATTYTAPGGSGGIGQTAGTAVAIVLGGNGGTGGTNGDINGAGGAGSTGLRLSGTVGSSGAGASSILGGGANALNTAGAGNAATGFGSGGSGGLSTANTARTGGAGSSGVIIIYEYR
jgi:hypothetical protein